ncbi:MAG: tRNA (adenosine(37)-N6)-dimethylallyltransferase MiaA [Lachnospiraceae bacterium]|nr:tRNA (adenosine(37)-N6)-dimethylallyltransferase MiaA [Lachnospiraceae bacterium]
MEKLVCIVGTNASGKSSLGIELARHYDADIVSADSRQVYEGLDLGSGKVTAEEMKGVRHYLIDVVKPNDFFSLSHFQKLAYDAIDEIHSKGRKAFLVGGTGLYVNAVADGYDLEGASPDLKMRKSIEQKSHAELIDIIRENDPEALNGVDLQNKRRLERAAERALSGDSGQKVNRPRYDTLLIGVTWPREELYERIRQRLDKRLSEGMIEEVEELRRNGASDDFLYRLGLEYRYILMYLRGEFPDRESFYDKLFMEIRHLAKEQMTWFRKRKDIVWIDMKDDPEGRSIRLIDEFYGGVTC